VHATAPKERIAQLRHEPVVGVALLALEAIGVNVDGGLLQTLADSLPEGLRPAG